MRLLIGFNLLIHLFTQSSADLAGYVHDKMQNFPLWVNQTKLDPIWNEPTVSTYSDSNEFVSMEIMLNNMIFSGYSRFIETKGIFADISVRKFSLDVCSDIHGGDAYGKHDTNWTAVNVTQRTRGRWFTWIGDSCLSECGIKFEILPSGFLNVTTVNTCVGHWNRLQNLMFDSEDNWALIGYEDYVKPIVNNAVVKYLFRAAKSFSAVFGRYWTEILAETTFEELVGYTGTHSPS